MNICQICQKEFKNVNGLAKHITNQHKNITKEQYYNTYICESSQFCRCGKSKKFRNLGVGYLEFCSVSCRSKFITPISYWLGKKQSQITIEKRQNTIEMRYGVNNGFLTKKSKCEKYKGFITRSSYERNFIDYCFDRGYKISVPNKIKYFYDGKYRWFYPDFYLEQFDLIVEVKSNWTYNLHLDMNIAKQVSVLEAGYDIIFIDEEDGVMGDWRILDEHFCFR